jgi:predicted nucleic acid-binding protein
MSKRVVLDAWAMLAMLQGEEPAGSDVRRLLQRAARGEVELLMSIINLGEVTYRIGKVKGEEAAFETLGQMQRLPITVLPATEDTVLAAVRYKIHHTISYADAFAAATADNMGAVLATGDPELIQLDGLIAVQKLARSPSHH